MVDENLALLLMAQNGDVDAKNELINQNYPLIKSVIKRYQNKGVEYCDLFQLGCVGFVKAINNFKASFGVKFSTYAVPMIIGEIRRHLRDNNPIRVSRSMRDLAYKALQAKEKILKETQKEPSIEEIAKELGVEKEDVVVSLDSTTAPNSSFGLAYLVSV